MNSRLSSLWYYSSLNNKNKCGTAYVLRRLPSGMHVADKWGNNRLSSLIVATLKCVDNSAAGLRFGGIVVECTHDQYCDMRLVHGINL